MQLDAYAAALFRARPRQEERKDHQSSLEKSQDECAYDCSRKRRGESGEKIASLNRTSFDGLRHTEERDLKREAQSGKSQASTAEGKGANQFARMRGPVRTARAAADEKQADERRRAERKQIHMPRGQDKRPKTFRV